uniref:Uncharacterized protein n=1 Tax=Desulfobacca acetoxidans TaxID=60893 RepID=A0A7C3V3M9_9BACT
MPWRFDQFLQSMFPAEPDIPRRSGSAEATLFISDALRAFSIRTLAAAKATDLNKAIIPDIVRERKSAFLFTDFIW